MKIYIVQDSKMMVLPINPSSLNISEKSKNREQTVLGLGDVNIPDVRGLNEIKFDSFFPFYWGHYCSVSAAELETPLAYLNKIMEFKNSQKPVRLTFAGNMQGIMKANGNVSGLFLVEDMDYEIKSGEEEDIYYTIKFKQYRNYEPRKITVQKPTVENSKPTVVIAPPTRPVLSTGSQTLEKVVNTRTYTVKSGDNLWNIARKYYGDGTKYPTISKMNNLKSTVIHPGQVLKIP